MHGGIVAYPVLVRASRREPGVFGTTSEPPIKLPPTLRPQKLKALPVEAEARLRRQRSRVVSGRVRRSRRPYPLNGAGALEGVGNYPLCWVSPFGRRTHVRPGVGMGVGVHGDGEMLVQ